MCQVFVLELSRPLREERGETDASFHRGHAEKREGEKQEATLAVLCFPPGNKNDTVLKIGAIARSQTITTGGAPETAMLLSERHRERDGQGNG